MSAALGGRLEVPAEAGVVIPSVPTGGRRCATWGTARAPRLEASVRPVGIILLSFIFEIRLLPPLPSLRHPAVSFFCVRQQRVNIYL